MASPQFPTRLDIYCSTFNVSLFDLRLPCVICKNIVPVSEAAEFHEKSLAVLWKNACPHLACRFCLRRLARYEQENFHSGVISARELAAQIGSPLLGILIRCNQCLRLLTSSEKADLLASNQPVNKVRDFYRAPCNHCKAI